MDCNVFEDQDTMTRAIHPIAITGANVFDDAHHAEVKRENLKRTNSSSYGISDDNMDNDDNCLQQNSWDALLKDIVLEENDEEVSDDEDLGDVGIEQNDLSKGSKNEMEEPIYEGHSMPCYVSMLLVLTYAICCVRKLFFYTDIFL